MRNLPSDLRRARYFRGHGVHSPFVYSIVRQVFMRSALISDKHSLHDALLECGVPKKRAVQLQNLMTHCGYATFGIDCDPDAACRCDMMIATAAVPAGRLGAMARRAAADGVTLCIVSPWSDRQRDEACRAIVAGHGCTSVDNRGYLLLFNNYLPKQTFRL